MYAGKSERRGTRLNRDVALDASSALTVRLGIIIMHSLVSAGFFGRKF